MAAWPAVRAYKQRTYELLGDRGMVLDVGCGPGLDIAAVDRRPGRRCVGVEHSVAMARRAAMLGATVCRGDAHRLPFPSRTFGAARADRVMQHLARPLDALAEMVRVVAPGGRVVIADPDQETLTIQVPGVRQSVVDRLKALRRDVGYRNGHLASRWPARFAETGIEGITVDAFPLVITDPALAFGLPTWPATWRSEGRFTDEELAEWDAAMAGRPAGFLYAVTFFVVAGTVS